MPLLRTSCFTLVLCMLPLACGSEKGGGDDCQPGTEMCACAEGNLCFSGLSCVGGTCFPSGDDTTGGTTPAEEELCQRADECNLLPPATSVQDCSDLTERCTRDLLSSQYADWQTEVNDCLGFANCQNFQSCVTELSACPFGGATTPCGSSCDTCSESGTCPADWENDGWCDCNCQFPDTLDCA